MNNSRGSETKRVEERANDLGPAQSYPLLLDRCLSIPFLKFCSDSHSTPFSDNLPMSMYTLKFSLPLIEILFHSAIKGA